MEDPLYQIAELVQYWIVYGFLPYSLLFYLVKLNRSIPSEVLTAFDSMACLVLIYSGRLIAAFLFTWYLLYTPPQEAWRPHSIGGFQFYLMSYGTLLQILTILIATQLLINPILRQEAWYRVLVGLAGYFVTEHFIHAFVMGSSKILVNTWDWDSGVEAFLFLFLPGLVLAFATAIWFFGKRIASRKTQPL